MPWSEERLAGVSLHEPQLREPLWTLKSPFMPLLTGELQSQKVHPFWTLPSTWAMSIRQI